jgi:hypothetical protein
MAGNDDGSMLSEILDRPEQDINTKAHAAVRARGTERHDAYLSVKNLEDRLIDGHDIYEEQEIQRLLLQRRTEEQQQVNRYQSMIAFCNNNKRQFGEQFFF